MMAVRDDGDAVESLIQEESQDGPTETSNKKAENNLEITNTE